MVQPGSFMKFLTGSERIPALGVPPAIELTFNHKCPPGCKCFPTVSTCALTLDIPVHVREDEILTIFSTAIINSIGFGRC